MNPHYDAVARRAAHRCEYCRAPEAIFNFPFEVDHVLPPSRAGGDELSNLALSCRSCNLRKSDHSVARDPEGGAEVPLFNPRRDRWPDHFEVQTDGTMRGRTAVGRATIERLGLNSVTQRGARYWWRRLGAFP